MAQGLSTPDPSLTPTHLSIRRGRATTTHHTHHQASLMVSRNTTLVPSLGLRIKRAYEAGLSAGMRRERVPPQIRKKERKYACSRKKLSAVVLSVADVNNSEIQENLQRPQNCMHIREFSSSNRFATGRHNLNT